MYKQILGEDIIKKQAKEILRYIFTSGIILMSIFIIRIFMVFNHKDYVYSIEMFIRQVNGAISIISIITCLILYKKTKDSIVFTLMLVYVGLSIAIITGQFDYYEYLNNKFRISNYISIITAFLRIIILFIAIKPNLKLHKLINKYKSQSFIFVAIYSIIGLEFEKKYFIGDFFDNKELFFSFNLLIFTVYIIVALKILSIGIKETKVILCTFSLSLFLFSIRSYISYME